MLYVLFCIIAVVVKGRGSWFLFGIIIFEILVGRNNPLIKETFGEICRHLAQRSKNFYKISPIDGVFRQKS